MSNGDGAVIMFFVFVFAYWLFFEIDFMLMTCFPLRAYRLGMKTRKFFRTKELYQDVIRYFENRCSCFNIPECCCGCEYDEGCKEFKCCCGILYIIKLFIVFTVGIVYWILLFPFLLLPLGCDCIYECKLRIKHPFKWGDFCYFCYDRYNEDDDEIMQALDIEDCPGNNNNSVQTSDSNKNNQTENPPIATQPYASDQTQQYSQTTVYQQCEPIVQTPKQEPTQAQQNSSTPVVQQSNPYASEPVQKQQIASVPVVEPCDDPDFDPYV